MLSSVVINSKHNYTPNKDTKSNYHVNVKNLIQAMRPDQ